MTNFDEIRIVEDGDTFVLLNTDEKTLVVTDLETANTLTDFELTNQWAEDAEDVFINDLTAFVDEMIELFGYTLLELED